MTEEEKHQVLLTQNDEETTVSESPLVLDDLTATKLAEQVTAGLENLDGEKLDELRKELGRALDIPPNIPPPGERGDPEDDIQVPNEKGYIPPIEDPYIRAVKYLERHNILQLFQGITAGIVYSRPDDPIQFMINQIEKVQVEENDRQVESLRKRKREKQRREQERLGLDVTPGVDGEGEAETLITGQG